MFIFMIFPEFFHSPSKSGLMGKAVESGIIKFEIMGNLMKRGVING